jgi:hypothetical protein
MEALERLVVLSPGVLLQYQKVQAQQLWLEMRPKQEKSKECEKQEEIDRHFDEFFNAYQESPFQIDEYEEFLDCREDIPIYETKQDPLDLDSLYCPHYTAICSNDPTETNCGSTVPTRSTTEKDMSAHLAQVPTNQATQMLVTDDWMFACTAKKSFESREPIIFGTGASLAITPNQHNFVEPPTSLSRPMTLGGMANDLEIKGIGVKLLPLPQPHVDQGQLYTDLTGQFPVRSSKGNSYVMVCYIYDCNYVKVTPMKSRSASEWVKA